MYLSTSTEKHTAMQHGAGPYLYPIITYVCKRTCVSAGIEAVPIIASRRKLLLNYPLGVYNGSTTRPRLAQKGQVSMTGQKLEMPCPVGNQENLPLKGYKERGDKEIT